MHANGACSTGWISPSVTEFTLDDCFNYCRDAGYFAYSTSADNCSCYTSIGGCPFQDGYSDHNAYKIKGN